MMGGARRAKRNAYMLLVGKPEGRRPLGRPRRRWVDNIRVDLIEVGWGSVTWIGLAQGRDRWRAPNPSGHTSPGVYSTSNRDEYQKQKNCVLGE
jgi:hypothetical protein